MKIYILLSLFVLFSIEVSALDSTGRFGWPEQKAPEKVIVCEPGSNLPEAMLLESLSGLAAQAVNEGSFDEMIWIRVKDSVYQRLFWKTTTSLKISKVKNMDIWTLLDYLKNNGVIKGYILYQADKARKNAYASYPDINYSSNVATVYASLLKGVLIDSSLVQEAQRHGLRRLKDARYESPEVCFEKNKVNLNNSSVLSIPPTVFNLRDYAISQKLMLYADDKKMANEILEWVNPLSPVLGWGCGDEFEFTNMVSRWGDYNTATNWCWNLPLISSLGSSVRREKVNEISLGEINFKDTSSFHAFIMSDGDNMQWVMSSFIKDPRYLGNQHKDNAGLSWTLCPTNLSIISPFTWNFLAEAQSGTSSYIEYGGGYQYPDLFATNRPNRKQLLREFARRINSHLQELGIKIFGFICQDVSSKEAQEAFQIYAEELTSITGMVVVQYFPYELDGAVYWAKNKDGIDIPVVTARYCIWNEVNKNRPRAGTPEYIASLINRDEIMAKENNNYMLSWTSVHAWSDFSSTSKITAIPAVGVNPVLAAKNLLIGDIKTVSANELLWRIRMKYRPEQTKSLLK